MNDSWTEKNPLLPFHERFMNDCDFEVCCIPCDIIHEQVPLITNMIITNLAPTQPVNGENLKRSVIWLHLHSSLILRNTPMLITMQANRAFGLTLLWTIHEQFMNRSWTEMPLTHLLSSCCFCSFLVCPTLLDIVSVHFWSARPS